MQNARFLGLQNSSLGISVINPRMLPGLSLQCSVKCYGSGNLKIMTEYFFLNVKKKVNYFSFKKKR